MSPVKFHLTKLVAGVQETVTVGEGTTLLERKVLLSAPDTRTLRVYPVLGVPQLSVPQRDLAVYHEQQQIFFLISLHKTII